MGIRYVPNNYILLSVELSKDEYDVISKRGWIEEERAYDKYGNLLSDSYSRVEPNYKKEDNYFFYLELSQCENGNWIDYNITLTNLTTKALEINSYLNYVFNDNVVRDVKLKVVTKHED